MISIATAPYRSSTEEQRSAARFTTNFAIGPMKAASSLLTESKTEGSSTLRLGFGVVRLGSGAIRLGGGVFRGGGGALELGLPKGEMDGGLAVFESEGKGVGRMATVCTVAASSSDSSREIWANASRNSEAVWKRSAGSLAIAFITVAESS